jgi:hypothetical protein
VLLVGPAAREVDLVEEAVSHSNLLVEVPRVSAASCSIKDLLFAMKSY